MRAVLIWEEGVKCNKTTTVAVWPILFHELPSLSALSKARSLKPTVHIHSVELMTNDCAERLRAIDLSSNKVVRVASFREVLALIEPLEFNN